MLLKIPRYFARFHPSSQAPRKGVSSTCHRVLSGTAALNRYCRRDGKPRAPGGVPKLAITVEPPGWRVSFFGELRRRNVLKVGAAYIVVAWLLIQIVDIVFPAIAFPAWTVTSVTLVLVLGFPVAVLLAWAYEVTPQGIKKRRRTRASTARLRPTQNLHSRTIRRR